MSSHAQTKAKPPRPDSAVPLFELRARNHGAGDLELEVWHLPSPASPHLETPRRLAGLRGRTLGLVETRILKQLRTAGIDVTGLKRGETRRTRLVEDDALRLGLAFRTLAPMRSRKNIAACASGIEEMGREEAAYWLGMAMHRKNPRRVLMALRFLLIDPRAA